MSDITNVFAFGVVSKNMRLIQRFAPFVRLDSRSRRFVIEIANGFVFYGSWIHTVNSKCFTEHLEGKESYGDVRSVSGTSSKN